MQLPPAEEPDGLNMTPIIDVVFLLLIFFLVATRFDVEEREIATRLAEVPKAQPLTAPPEEVIVNVSDKGEYVVAGRTVPEELLAGFLHALAVKNPGTQRVQIRVDHRAAFLYPARVMGLCERERIQHYCTVIQEQAEN